MPRLPRRSQLADDVCYHVMNRGHNRERVFRDDQDRLEFLARLDQAKSRHGFLLHHYCLMSNHFHLVIRPRRPLDLSRIVAGLLRSYRGDWAIGDAKFRMRLCHLNGRAAPRGRGRPRVKA